VYLAVCNIGVEKSVTDPADALSQAQSKHCMARGNIIKRRRNPSTQGEESPKGQAKGRENMRGDALNPLGRTHIGG